MHHGNLCLLDGVIMSTEITIFERKDLAISATPEISARIEQVLSESALVGLVVDAETNETANESLKAITGLAGEIEKARKKVKEPVLELGRAIDAEAKRLSEVLLTEKNRLARASADWQTEQLERVRAQERARQAELDRIQREKEAEEARIRAEEQRKIDEANRKAREEAAAARNAEEQAAAEKRRQDNEARIKAEAEAASKRAAELSCQDVATLKPAPVLQKASGQSVKEVWEFEVVNPFDLFRARPDLVTLTAKAGEIKAAIDLLAVSGEPKIAGLRIFRQVKVSTRSTKGATVDV